jgi:hypothetical protein
MSVKYKLSARAGQPREFPRTFGQGAENPQTFSDLSGDELGKYGQKVKFLSWLFKTPGTAPPFPWGIQSFFEDITELSKAPVQPCLVHYAVELNSVLAC